MVDRESENSIPAGESQAEWADCMTAPETTRRSERWLDIKEIAGTAFVPSITLAGCVLGGVIAGKLGVPVGGILGLGASLAVVARFPGLIRR